VIVVGGNKRFSLFSDEQPRSQRPHGGDAVSRLNPDWKRKGNEKEAQIESRGVEQAQPIWEHVRKLQTPEPKTLLNQNQLLNENQLLKTTDAKLASELWI
jgi:hypothetical protein